MPLGQLAQVLRGLSQVQGADERTARRTGDLRRRGRRRARGRRRSARGQPARARADGRLLPAGRRRPVLLRRDRGGERALGRLRDGRAAVHRAQHRRHPEGLPRGLDRRDLPRRLREDAARRARSSSAATRSSRTRRCSASRSRASSIAAAIAANAGARPGDVLYLTKPLGMGAMTTAAKQQKITWEELEPAARQMATLNDRAAEAMNAAGAHACTDITGFGLVGHARNIARASGVTIRIELATPPALPRRPRPRPRGRRLGRERRAGGRRWRRTCASAPAADEALVQPRLRRRDLGRPPDRGRGETDAAALERELARARASPCTGSARAWRAESTDRAR